MYENVRISKVLGDGPHYTVRASSDGAARRDTEFTADRVYINGVRVTTGTNIELPGEPLEIEEDEDGIKIESQ